jgi:ectoine hydroxylase-related dioxygenase (phytanoyl-CoA dioxygenase family)
VADQTPAGAGDPDRLRAEAAERGYLVLRGVLPGDVLDELRSRLVEVLARAGLIVAPATGAASTVLPADPAAPVDVHSDRPLFAELYSLEALHALPHHPCLISLAATLLGVEGDVLVHPRPALRVVFPGTPQPLAATPPHQDLLGMQGTADAYTFWIPLTRCPPEAGSLSLASSSHRGGLRPFLPYPGARVASCDAADLEERWVSFHVEPGDVIAFHSLTVHRALPNLAGQVRLSVDARYQRAGDPVCELTVGERGDLSWDDLYAGWSPSNDHLRRYWERMALDVVPFDASLLTPA